MNFQKIHLKNYAFYCIIIFSICVICELLRYFYDLNGVTLDMDNLEKKNNIEQHEHSKELQQSVDEKFFELQADKENKKPKKKFWKEGLLWIEAFLIAIIIAYLINAFVFERALVDGQSMYPTLEDRQSLFEYKLGYFFDDPDRGDIIIMEYFPGEYKSRFYPLPDKTEVNYVKRIVGMPGETVDVREDGFVYINGVKLDEPYITNNPDGTGITSHNNVFNFPMTLGEDEYFVLGDNRQNSRDSREIGPIKRSQIRGKALAVILPLDDMKMLN